MLNSATVNDYKPVGTASSSFVTNTFSLTNTGSTVVAKPLFNGNIASMLVNLPKLGQAQVYGYGYDQLNRIVSMDAFTGLTNTTNVLVPAASDNYNERITYDANGNIQTYLRNGETASSGQLMDNLRYQYERDANGNKLSNKLRYVLDLVQGNGYSGDLKTQSSLNETQFNNDKSASLTGDNYRYDKIGNLTKDYTEGITNITWSVYGKILSVAKSASTITYTYDGTGNRISKTVNGVTTWYVRDATGNVMAVYEKRADLNSNHLTQTEVHLYGSSRLGILTTNRDVETAGSPGNGIFERGNKFFELSNHLQNVLVTISDKKIGVDSDGNGTIDYYNAEVISSSDLYPYGMTLPGRTFNALKYRYGFNGIEKDDDCECGEKYTATFRHYDPRLARWFSPDPQMDEDPDLSPYMNNEGNPIVNSDQDGDCPWCFIKALIDASIEIAGQLVSGKRINQIDWTDVLVSAVQGFASGVSPAGWVNSSKNLIKAVKIGKKVANYGGDMVKAAIDNGKVNDAKTIAVNYSVTLGANAAFKYYGSKILKPKAEAVNNAVKVATSLGKRVEKAAKATQKALEKADGQLTTKVQKVMQKQQQSVTRLATAEAKVKAAKDAVKVTESSIDFAKNTVSNITQNILNPEPDPNALYSLHKRGEFSGTNNRNIFKSWVDGGKDRIFLDYEGNQWQFTGKDNSYDEKNIKLIKKKE